MNTDQLTQESREIIQHGSKSFSLASYLFSREVMQGSHLLYNWCRFCDDYIDEAPEGTDPSQRVADLRRWTEAAIAGEKTEHPAFTALATLIEKYQIPAHYPIELIEGMHMDTEIDRYQNFEQLELYCYRVASTVGLMMCHIMGLSDDKALRHASDLGIAMQLTNIARDVNTDYRMDRIYLPQEWLQSAEIDSRSLMQPLNRVALSGVVRRLLLTAENYYQSADQGLRYLNWPSALAVCAAKEIYREIGLLVMRRGLRAWNSRTYVGLARKLWLVGRALIKVTWIKLPHFQWRAKSINTVWRYQ